MASGQTVEAEVRFKPSSLDVLAFKTCCGFQLVDQNIEFLLHNRGAAEIEVASYVDVVVAGSVHRIANLMPQGTQRIAAGDSTVFYGYLDEELWNRSPVIKFFDGGGKEILACPCPKPGQPDPDVCSAAGSDE